MLACTVGINQLAEVKGFSVSFHGDPDFMYFAQRDMVFGQIVSLPMFKIFLRQAGVWTN